MTFHLLHLPRALTIVSLLTFLTPAAADEAQLPTKITLHPAAAPRPLLKYRLQPEFIDRIPGNAAVYYGKVKAEQNPFFSNRELLEKIDRWTRAPLDELRREQASVQLSDRFLEQAALCEYCDWQLPIRREPFYGILLPEAQESRQFSRILCAQARIDIAHGDYESAVKRCQFSYSLARNIAEGETLVNGLIGVAMCGMTNSQLRELLQQAGAPNLYWALSMLPRPMIDFRDAIEAELSALEMAIPELRRPEQSGRTAEQWRATLLELWKLFHEYSDEPVWKKPPESLLEASLENYPAAKRALAERGWTADELEAMPAEQVVVLELMTLFREIGHQATTAFFLPYPEAMRGLNDAKIRVEALRLESDKNAPLAELSLGPFQACRTAQARTEREFAVLQFLEALRIHAANHDGRLPERLRDLTDVPVPNDPVTGRPFRYLLDGKIARLGGPALGDVPLDYEITVKHREE